MRQKIDLLKAEFSGDRLLLEAKTTSLEDVTATGQMLVDSDHFAFIYIVDLNQEYTYVLLQEEIWPQLKKALDDDSIVYLTNGQQTIELLSFKDELSYLVENIKGNSNYGEEMVTKVEAHF